MENTVFDIEKDFLAITRKEDGAFNRFFWFPADKFTLAEVEAKIADFNEKHKKAENIYTAELVTDKLVKEICNYKQQAQPLEDIKNDAQEIQKSIDKAAEYLQDAIADLNRIRGLD